MCGVFTSPIVGMEPIKEGASQYEPFIGVVLQRGTAFNVKSLATGIGSYFANQMLESEVRKSNGQLEKDQALEIVKKALQISYYRDCHAACHYNIAVSELDEGGSPRAIVSPKSESLATNWDISERVSGQFY